MPPLHRDPYVVRVRNTRAPKVDEDAKDSYMAFGADSFKGVEVRIQTERGALSLKVRRNALGDEVVVLRAFPHTDFAGRRVGLDSVLWSGSVDGQVHGQAVLFPEDT
jgi:hypothetical protein